MFNRLLVPYLDGCLCAASVALITSDIKNEDSQRKGRRPRCSRDEVVRRCRGIVRQKLYEFGAPGMVVGVAIDGRQIWSEGFGYADIENGVPCRPETVMRIASISKPLTMAAVAKLIEDGKLDLDKPVTEYVREFPDKFYDNKKVTITTRMLLSHTSGIRHYQKPGEDEETKKVAEFKNEEYYSTKEYAGVIESLDMFKDDNLFHSPGEKFLYTTHGYTLVSAVVEKAAGEDFLLHMKKLFSELGMKSTVPETQTDIIYHRARHYVRNDKGRLVNTPYVNNSYKWAGGGFLSNTSDLLKFGNVMLSCYQSTDCDFESGQTPPFLKAQTLKDMWSPLVKMEEKKDRIPNKQTYGLGWFVCPPKPGYKGADDGNLEVSHTGGAIGGSSVLYILPLEERNRMPLASGDPTSGTDRNDSCSTRRVPRGIVVSILTNLQSVNLTELARTIANEFRKLRLDENF